VILTGVQVFLVDEDCVAHAPDLPTLSDAITLNG
jgi:hypothetical protein